METEAIFRVKQAFNAVLFDFRIGYLQGSEIYYTCNFCLESFIESLTKLEAKDLAIHTLLVTRHKDPIHKAKKLIAKLRLQGLPTPSATISHRTYYDNRQKSTTQPYININNYDIWRYFFNFHDTHHWVRGVENRPKVRAKEEEYLAMVKPGITGICEAITAIICHYLADVRKKDNT